jgi:cytoskeletal protein CcmA (bactofilin family)
MARGNPEISVLGATTRLTGKVGGEGGLRIEGRVAGDVTITGPAEIAEGASVEGDVHAESLDVSGTLIGDALTRGPITVRADAVVRGELAGSRVTVEPGARVAVRLNTDFELDLAPAPAPRRRR